MEQARHDFKFGYVTGTDRTSGLYQERFRKFFESGVLENYHKWKKMEPVQVSQHIDCLKYLEGNSKLGDLVTVCKYVELTQ